MTERINKERPWQAELKDGDVIPDQTGPREWCLAPGDAPTNGMSVYDDAEGMLNGWDNETWKPIRVREVLPGTPSPTAVAELIARIEEMKEEYHSKIGRSSHELADAFVRTAQPLFDALTAIKGGDDATNG